MVSCLAIPKTVLPHGVIEDCLVPVVQRLPRGQMSFDYTDPDTGEQLAVFDLAWPDGVQAELSQPVAVLLDEGGETLAVTAKAGYRCFTRIHEVRIYVTTEISPAVGAVA